MLCGGYKHVVGLQPIMLPIYRQWHSLKEIVSRDVRKWLEAKWWLTPRGNCQQQVLHAKQGSNCQTETQGRVKTIFFLSQHISDRVFMGTLLACWWDSSFLDKVAPCSAGCLAFPDNGNYNLPQPPLTSQKISIKYAFFAVGFHQHQRACTSCQSVKILLRTLSLFSCQDPLEHRDKPKTNGSGRTTSARTAIIRVQEANDPNEKSRAIQFIEHNSNCECVTILNKIEEF